MSRDTVPAAAARRVVVHRETGRTSRILVLLPLLLFVFLFAERPAKAETAGPDVVVTVADSADPVDRNAEFTYTIRTSNVGNVRLDPTLFLTPSEGLEVVGITTDHGTCFKSTPQSCSLRRLHPGVTATVSVTARAAGAEQVWLKASAPVDRDVTPANNTSTEGTNCDTCGNLTCDGSETCATCPGDCGDCRYCGDGVCGGDETQRDCPEDCGSAGAGCGDGVCAPLIESWWTCPHDCEPDTRGVT